MHATDLQRDKVSRLVTWGHWFAFINGLLAALIAVRFVNLMGWPDTPLAQLYSVITLLGHFSFVSFLLYLLLLFPISLILPYSKILRGYAAIIATLAHMVLVYDTLVFDHYRLHLNPFVFDISFADLPKLISNPWILVAPAVMLAVQLLLSNGLWKRIERLARRSWGGKIATVMISMFLGSHLLHIWADANIYQPIVQQDEMLPLHYPATARSFMASRGIVDEETLAERETSALPTKQLTYPSRALQCQAEPGYPVLLVTIDALRRDTLTPETMPFLSSWAEGTHDFKNHYSGSNEWGPGLRSLLYGLLPAYGPSLLADQKPPVLATELIAKGYSLVALGIASSKLEPATKLALDSFALKQEQPYDSAAQRDIQTTDQALTLLQGDGGKMTLLVQYHAPSVYSTPVGYVGLPTVKPELKINEAQAVLFNQYRSSLKFLDSQLERLLTHADDNTLIIVTGNNGQEFSSLDNTLSRNFSDATTGVPLMIRWPGDVGKKISYPTSHYALAPTLLTNLLGCRNNPSEYSLGDSLYAPSNLGFLVAGNRHFVAIKTKESTTVIDKHGDYRVYDRDQHRIRDAKLDTATLLKVMDENRRLFIN